ncbi:hypothetical protein [Sabulibacter ruber]|uniref:hypothetical protein n=1 Tax=Sabulibacter ruber TaxID=2811901 RepID=UPI001A960FA4|nr:hypothetical protein [Sabulibacter ruber]
MEKEDLQRIIHQLEASNSKEEAHFGIYSVQGHDESFIHANKQGLELFAVGLLKASLITEETILENPKAVIPLNYGEDWIDEESHTLIQYIEPSIEKRNRTVPEPAKETWSDKAMKVGCISGLVFALVSGVVGLVTIVRWIF